MGKDELVAAMTKIHGLMLVIHLEILGHSPAMHCDYTHDYRPSTVRDDVQILAGTTEIPRVLDLAQLYELGVAAKFRSALDPIRRRLVPDLQLLVETADPRLGDPVALPDPIPVGIRKAHVLMREVARVRATAIRRLRRWLRPHFSGRGLARATMLLLPWLQGRSPWILDLKLSRRHRIRARITDYHAELVAKLDPRLGA